MEPVKSRSNSHGKTPMELTILVDCFIAAKIFWHQAKRPSEICLFITETLHFLWESKKDVIRFSDVFIQNPSLVLHLASYLISLKLS